MTGKYPARLQLTDWIPGRKQWPTARLLTPAFAQQLPLAETTIAELLRPAAMSNLMGDLWDHGEPNWAAALSLPNVKLHLYGKMSARPGRKMGHLTALGETADDAVATAITARNLLLP